MAKKTERLSRREREGVLGGGVKKTTRNKGMEAEEIAQQLRG